MHESIDVFKKVSNHNSFANTPIIIFFNKIDLFREKIVKKSINVCFNDYDGDNSYESSMHFIETKFKKHAQSPNHNHFVHTCAIETECVKMTLNNVLEIITADYLSKRN